LPNFRRLRKLIRCDFCPVKFGSIGFVARHIKAKHKDVPQLECNFCQKLFWSKKVIAYHIKDHAEVVGVTGSTLPFACRFCRKVFPSIRALITHRKRHIRGNVCTCEICGKSFPYGDYLTRHRKIHIEGPRKYPCHLCKYSNWSLAHLKIHILTHSNEKNEICSQCGKAYVHRSFLLTHIKSAHVVQKITFKCLVCDKDFSSQESLKRHLLIHQGLKQHECHLCGKSCVQLSNLHTHQRLVHKLLPFKCESCDETFRYKEELKNHCIDVHPPMNR